jgi:transposase InsO family protein
MAKTIKEERLRWVMPIVNKQIRLVDAAKVCPYGKRSLERWVAVYKKHGEAALEPKSTRPKTSPKETPIRIKERIIELRKEEKRCAFKLALSLREEGICLHHRTIGKILKNEGLTRKYRVKRVKYKYLKAKLEPGELIEVDVKYVPGKIAGERYFQYTAIDCASRWRHLAVFEEQSNHYSIMFLKDVIEKFPYRIRAVKTDNGFVFTNWYTGTYKRTDFAPKQPHAFSRFCAQQGIIHYLIDPGKPQQNGKVERSHRTDQESFYDTHAFASGVDLKKKLRLWNTKYNNLAHCSLNGKSPNQFLRDYVLTNPPNVYA